MNMNLVVIIETCDASASKMGLPEVVEFGRTFAVMVRVQGPDPKGLKMRRHAFHQYNSGITTLSASGVLLPSSLFHVDAARKGFCGGEGYVSVVVTVASVVEHFLSVRYREAVDSQVTPELIQGAEIHVMVEGTSQMKNDRESMEGLTHQWFPAKLLTIIDVPQSSMALRSVFEASSGSAENGWDVGWSLASSSNTVQKTTYAYSKDQQGVLNGGQLGNSCAKFVVLGFSSPIFQDLPGISISNSVRKGDLLLAMGSPFGVLSPLHFLNSIAVGSVSNSYPLNSNKKSLLMADIRCLPGMEGGPVFNNQRELIGIITRPARQKNSGAEVQIVIPWEAIAASTHLLNKESQIPSKQNDMGIIVDSGNNYQSNSQSKDRLNTRIRDADLSVFLPPSPAEHAATSVCLITVDDGTWASGILLNMDGLILTNAHLLEPWRFGKTTVTGGRDGDLSDSRIMNKYAATSFPDGRMERGDCLTLQKAPSSDEYPPSDMNMGYSYSPLAKGYRRIHVRLGQQYPWTWSSAIVVYVSKGPLDVALLQLDHIPNQLIPINVESACPSPGSQAFVIGHGLFGPRSGSAPSVNLGVVAKVVTAKMNTSRLMEATEFGDVAVMMETTATVHPGCSGGAVVNSRGYMIGLVTSNSRHGGGTVIPHLNFSIPCAAMESIFEFSKDMRNFSLLHDLDKPNSELSSIWSLAPPVSPKPEPSSLPKLLLEPPNKSAKGSRFAKFMADKEHLPKISTENGELAKALFEKIQSKL